MPPHYVYGSFQSSANYTSTKLTNLTSVLLNNPMDYSLPGSSVHEISQARILEWVAMPSSRGSSRPRDQIQVSGIAGRFFTV